jgi:hypothetical protein
MNNENQKLKDQLREMEKNMQATVTENMQF